MKLVKLLLFITFATNLAFGAEPNVPQIPAPLTPSPTRESSPTEVRHSDIHGNGVFATTGITAGTRVLQYVGENISKSESLRRCEQGNAWLFAVSEERDLDGNVPWNPARFLNHSCDPNCDAVLDDGHIWIVARRNIAPDEELTFNYGYDLVDYRDYPCRCGTPTCVGYMVSEEFFEHVRRNTLPQPSDR